MPGGPGEASLDPRFLRRRQRPYRDIVFIACPPSTMMVPPIGVGYIAEYLRRQGYEAPIIDLNISMFKSAEPEERRAWELDHKNVWLSPKPLQKLMDRFSGEIDAALNEALSYERYLIGFTVLHSREALVSALIRRIKERAPQRLVVVGGPTLAAPRMRQAFSHECPYDFAVVGEGEVTTRRILEGLRNGDGSNLQQLPGVIHRLPAQTQDITIPPPLLPLDRLPFPRYRGLHLEDYGGQDPFPVLWSRGCPGRCAFCESTRIWGKHRSRSPENIHQELVYITRHMETRHIAPFDSIINGHLPHLMQVARMITEQGPEITWEGNFMASSRMSQEIYQALHRSGCRRVYFGLETASPAVLQSMKKPFSLQTAIDNILWAHGAGCQVYLNFITGFPGEDQQHFEESLEFLRQYKDFISGIEFITECQIPEETDLWYNPELYDVVFDRDFAGFHWESADGANTYQVRQQRSRALEEEAYNLGIRSSPSTTLTDGVEAEDIF